MQFWYGMNETDPMGLTACEVAEKKEMEMKLLSKYCVLLYVFLLTGCIGGVERAPKTIGFAPVIGHDTRAAEESMPFPEDRTFNVWATDQYGTAVLAGETVAHSAAGWMSTKPWPESEVLFAAYYPSDLAPEYIPGHGFIINDFEASSDDVEVLIAHETTGEEGTDGVHSLHFEHILSRVDFRVKHSLAGDIEVKAVKAEMVGFGLSGDYNVTGDYEWDVDDTGGRITIYEAGPSDCIAVDGAPQYIGDQFLVIPQHCKAKIYITFHVRIGNGGWVEDRVGVGPLNTEWQPGKQYTYTMNLTDTKMTYTTGITSWTSK